MVVRLLNRYSTDHQLKNLLDLVAVYLLVWQFVQLICHWASHELWGLLSFFIKHRHVSLSRSSPSLDMICSSVIFRSNFTTPFCRYVRLVTWKWPRTNLNWTNSILLLERWHFLLLQTFSFAYLHPRGYLRKEPTASANSLSVGSRTYPSGLYYPEEYETKDAILCAFGLGDFFCLQSNGLISFVSAGIDEHEILDPVRFDHQYIYIFPFLKERVWQTENVWPSLQPIKKQNFWISAGMQIYSQKMIGV